MPGFNLQDLLQARAAESDAASLPVATSSNLLPDTASAQPDLAREAARGTSMAGNTGETVTVPKTDWLRALQVAGLALRDVGSSLQGKPTNFLLEQLLAEEGLTERKAAGQRAERATTLAEQTAARSAAVQAFTVEGALMDRAYKLAGTIDPTIDNVERAVQQLVQSGRKAGVEVDPTLIRGMFTYRDVISKNLPQEYLPYIPADPDIKREMLVAERKGEAEVDRLTKRLGTLAESRAFASAQAKLAEALPRLRQQYGERPIPMQDILSNPLLDAGEKRALMEAPLAETFLATLNVEPGSVAQARIKARAIEKPITQVLAEKTLEEQTLGPLKTAQKVAEQTALLPGKEEETRKLEQIKADIRATGEIKPAEVRQTRQEFERGSQSFVIVRDAFGKLQGAATSGAETKDIGRRNAADISLIYNYITMLDPRSTVREGEEALVEQARGVPENTRRLYNKLVGGGILTDSQRAGYAKEAENLFDVQLKAHVQREDEYRRIAKEAKIPETQVIVDLVGNEYRKRLSDKRTGGAAPDLTGAPDAALHPGAVIRDETSGRRFRSDGKRWVPQ